MALSTYSIVACDFEEREWGVAVESKFLAVGSLVAWAEPEVGALATQAWANVRYGPDGLALLRQGASAQETVERLTSADDERGRRQLGVVDGQGWSASYTGPECLEWAGGRTGPAYAAQGNLLVSRETVDALAETFEATADRRLAERLLECLTAAQRAGGDRRGQQSASLYVVKRDGGYGGTSDVVVDLRVDDHATPVDELRRLYDLHDLLFGETPADEWVEVDEALERELRDRLGRLGYRQEGLGEAFEAWAGMENFEDRVDGVARIDPVVLSELRKRTPS
jgi:uncharacterized Ntn-hydrolase superfamily protein